MRLTEISLVRWRAQKVFVGLEAGHTCREFFKLDELDKVGMEVTVTIPDEVYSVNSSFFSRFRTRSRPSSRPSLVLTWISLTSWMKEWQG